jgi:hypothetical protein
VITKPFILAKDNYRMSARILRDNKIIRDHGAFPAAFAERAADGAEAARVADVRAGAAVAAVGAPIHGIAS